MHAMLLLPGNIPAPERARHRGTFFQWGFGKMAFQPI